MFHLLPFLDSFKKELVEFFEYLVEFSFKKPSDPGLLFAGRLIPDSILLLIVNGLIRLFLLDSVLADCMFPRIYPFSSRLSNLSA